MTTEVERIVRFEGTAYHFSDDLIAKFERGEVEFITPDGDKLKPEYFGGGLSGKNGILLRI